MNLEQIPQVNGTKLDFQNWNELEFRNGNELDFGKGNIAMYDWIDYSACPAACRIQKRPHRITR